MDDDLQIIKKNIIDGLEARLDKDCSEEELWIVKEFLSSHNIQVNQFDIHKEPEDSKIDVVFKDCCFQVKKIIFPEDYKPNAEDKTFKKSIQNSHTKEELIDAREQLLLSSTHISDGLKSKIHLKGSLEPYLKACVEKGSLVNRH